MSSDRMTRLLDELQGLLERQKKMVRRSDLRGVEVAVARAGTIVEDIVGMRGSERSGLSKRAAQLMKEYDQLQLMIAAQKHNVGEHMRRIAEGRKALGAYRANP
jgi:hypothetical protein